MWRESIGGDVDDPRFVGLVGGLSLTSGRFRALWARHDVRTLERGTTTMNHPVVGEMPLHVAKLPVNGQPDHFVVAGPEGNESCVR